MERISVVGVGPGGKDCFTPAALRAVEEAGVLVGGARNLALFEGYAGETFVIKNNLAEMTAFIKMKRESQKVAVLASGDPGMFGILTYLKKHFKPDELQVIPGISSVQYACARLAMPWHDAVIVSTHGRDRNKLIEAVKSCGKVVALAGPGEPPRDLALALVKAGIRSKNVYVCSDLSYPEERIRSYSLEDLASRREGQAGKNYIMVIVDEG